MSDQTRELLKQLTERIADLIDEGRPDEAVPLAAKLCQIARGQIGEGSLEHAEALSTAAEVSRELDEVDEARTHYQLARDIIGQVCGEQDMRYAEALEELAALEYYDCEYEQAAEYRWQALAIQRVILGDDHPACISAIRELVDLYGLTGNDERVDYLEDLLGQSLDEPRADPALEAQVANLNRQVVGLWNQQDFREALTVARRAATAARQLGPAHPYYASAVVNLGQLEQSVGDRSQCESLFKEAIEARRASLGADHPDFAAALVSLAEYYRDIGRHTDAEALYRRALTIQRVSGEPVDLLATLNGLGLLLQGMHHDDDSEAVLSEALERCLDAGLQNTPEHAMCLNNLAMLLSSKGEPRKAMPLYRDALEAMRQSTGRQYPQYAATLNNLALLHKKQEEYPEAERLYQESLELKRELYGDDHPETTIVLHNLGQLRRTMGDTRRARELFQQALEIQRRTLGEGHPSVAMTLESIAELNKDAGQDLAREVNLNEALDIKRATYGKDHAETRRTEAKVSGAEDAERRCLQAFVDRDYDFCARQMQEYIRITSRTNPRMALLVLLGMQRQGHDELAQGNAAKVAQVLTSHPWELFLLRIVMGDAEPRDARKPLTDLQRCQLHYYYGARLLTEGRSELAAKEFADCLAGDVECGERICAMADQSYSGPARIVDTPERVEVHWLNDQAQLAQQEGRIEDALTLSREGSDLARRAFGENDTSLARSLCNEAVALRSLGDLATAEACLLGAQSIYRQHYGASHTISMILRQNLAAIYFDQGRHAESRPLLEEDLEMERRTHGADTLEYATILRSLGTSCSMTGELPRAERLFEEAHRIFIDKLGPASEPLADCLSEWGRMYAVAGSLDLAEGRLREAIAVARQACGERHQAMMAAQTAMADVLMKRQRPAEAEQLLEDVLAIRRETLGDRHELTGATLNHLGVACQSQGKFGSALVYQQQAAAISARVKGEEHADHAAALFNLALAEAGGGHPREALRLMQQAAAIDERMIGQIFGLASADARLMYSHQLGGLIHFLLSLVTGPLKDDDSPAIVALDLVLRRKALAAEAMAAQRDAILGDKYPHLRDKFRELGERRQELARVSLKGTGLDSIFEGQPGSAALLESLSQQLGGLMGQALQAAPRQRLQDLQQQVERLEADLARQVVEMNLTDQLHAIDHRVIADRLPAKTTLIEFVRFFVYDFLAVPLRGELQWKAARYVAFVIPAGQPDKMQLVDLGEAELIDELIRRFRAEITGEIESRGSRDLGAAPVGPMIADDTRCAQELRALVFDKLVPALAGNQRLILAPDGDLSRLPFEVLPGNAEGRLIDDYQISYVTVGRDVLRFGAKSDRLPSAAIVAADPDFDLGTTSGEVEIPKAPSGKQSRDLERSHLSFGKLPGTRVEGEHIAAMLDVEPWLDAGALESRLKMCRSPQILHLATHGFFLADQARDPNKNLRDLGAIGPDSSNNLSRLSAADLENPLLRSGLALAGVNHWLKGGAPPAEAEDGLLTAEDVTGLDLIDTELVVLSACETGLGTIHVGEGVFGLRRAFVLAGAKTLVMSLWKVPDQQTQELMEDFYRRLLAGQGRATALREAQWALKARYPNPLYWGAFICQGDPAPLTSH